MTVSNDQTHPSDPQPLRIKAEANSWAHPQPTEPLPPVARFPPPTADPLPAEWGAPGTSQAVAGSRAAAFGPPILPSEPAPDLRRRQVAELAPLPPPGLTLRAEDGADLGATPHRQSRLRSFAAPVGSRRRHAAAAARIVAVGLSTTGFVVGIASLATAQPDGEIGAASPDVTSGTIIQTRTVHRTVYVDEQGNPVPEFDPSIAQAAIDSAVAENGRVTGDSPWPAPAMISGVEASADEVAAEEQFLLDQIVARPDSNDSTRSSGQGSRRIPTSAEGDETEIETDAATNGDVADEDADVAEESEESLEATDPAESSAAEGAEQPGLGEPDEPIEPGNPDDEEPAVATTVSRPSAAPTTTIRPATTTTRPATTTTRLTTTSTTPSTTTPSTTTTTTPSTTTPSTTTPSTTTPSTTTPSTTTPSTTTPSTTTPSTTTTEVPPVTDQPPVTDVPPVTDDLSVMDESTTTLAGASTTTGLTTATSKPTTTTRPTAATTQATVTTVRPTTTTSAPTTPCTGSKCHS